MFFKFVKALKQDWISPWQVGMVGLCSVSALSLAQDSDLPRESALESFQRAAHILESSQHPKKLHTLLRDINKSLPKYLTREISRYIERDN